MRQTAWLLTYFIGGTVRRHPLRSAVQVLAIATGVSLGWAVHLINASALSEFSAAVRQVSGQADASVVGPREGFDEAILAQIAADEHVRLASPVIDIEVLVIEQTTARTAPVADATLVDGANANAIGSANANANAGASAGASATASASVKPAAARGRRVLRLLGVDALRLPLYAPQWLGRPLSDPPASADKGRFALLDDGVFLSPDAMRSFNVRPGDTLQVQAGSTTVALRVVGDLPAAAAGSMVGAMDIGWLQWRLGWAGRLSRIDLALADGASAQALRTLWALPGGVALETAEAATTRVSNLSRAYRVNLNVLAMVALFTGAFLVFSLQSQSVLARRAQLAFLRILGATRGEVQRLLLLESALLGALGGALGLAVGALIAAAALALLGGDLGGGYFQGVQPRLHVAPWMAVLFFVLGVAAAMVGGWLPAREAAAEAPARAIKTGSGLDIRARPRDATGLGVVRRQGWRAVAAPILLLAAGVACVWLPPVAGIPVFAYLSVALLLVAAIGMKPLLAPPLFRAAGRWAEHIGRRPLPNNVPGATRGAARRAARDGASDGASDAGGAPRPARAAAWLALTRVAANPRFAAIGAAGIVASFALMVAMLTMVASFRGSVDDWLGRVLPADLYVRAGPVNTQATFSAADLAAMASHPQVARADFAKVSRLTLAADRAPVTLLARVIDRNDAAQSLPMAGQALRWQPGMPPPVWVSEAMVDLYGARVGAPLALPLAGKQTEFMVLGVWRDYARQFGSVAIDVNDYAALTGDAQRTDASLWLRPDARASDVAQQLASRLDARGAEFAEPGEIRALSLRIFDRSFAVTYVLQVAAIIIGLVGIAATFSAQAIARTREFGVLRHLGCTRGQILMVLAFEGLMVTLLALMVGLTAGLAIAWVLVDVVNPQSFHWTMDFLLPFGRIAVLIGVLLVAATLTAVLAGRRAVAPGAIAAVREDW